MQEQEHRRSAKRRQARSVDRSIALKQIQDKEAYPDNAFESSGEESVEALEGESVELGASKNSKQVEPYHNFLAPNSQFFSTRDPDEIEESLVAYLRKIKIEPLINKQKYKIKFTRKEKHSFSNDHEDIVESCVRILRVNKDSKEQK